MTNHELARRFLRDSAVEIERLATTTMHHEAARVLSTAVDQATDVPFAPQSVRAVRDIDESLGPLADAVRWEPSFRSADGGELVALAPLGELFDFGTVAGSPELIIGLMHVSAGATYPEHQHPPQELYLVLSGTGWWRSNGGSDYVEARPPALVTNPPAGLHGLRTTTEPVTALYVLW